MGGAALTPYARSLAQVRNPTATVLYGDRTTTVHARSENRSGDSKISHVLWIRKLDLPRVNGFELKPQGACRADVCIPVSKDMTQGPYFNLTAFAYRIGEPVVCEAQSRVWSFGEIPVLGGSFVNARMAPDFALANRKGQQVRLSDFRGRKVLLLTWASW
jgi:hypothetical protein